MTVGIAGSGRVAQALGKCLEDAGQPVDAVASRSAEHAREAARFIGGACQAVRLNELRCDRILIAVSDQAIVETAALLPPCHTLLHTCGAHGAELLAIQAAAGVHCGSVHPFQTCATPEAGYHALPGSAFAVDGDPEALAWAEQIVRLLRGVILRIPAGSRALYHAAAVMASNHLIATLDAAAQLLASAGVPDGAILQAIQPIAAVSLANAMREGPAAALTGPVQRGDAGTVSIHMEAIRSQPPAIQQLYYAASLQALAMATRSGLDSERAQAVRLVLDNLYA